jgi:hypothetical protein
MTVTAGDANANPDRARRGVVNSPFRRRRPSRAGERTR